MTVMLLAAGLGMRMRPLSEHTPKPLLKVHGRPLIEYQIERLAAGGWRHFVINVHHLARQIIDTLGDGTRFGIEIVYSHEPVLLGTAGGIKNALPLFKGDQFLLTSADILTDFPYDTLLNFELKGAAHIVVTDPLQDKPEGDFELEQVPYNYAGIAMCSKALFDPLPHRPAEVGPLLRREIQAGQVSYEVYRGHWQNIGNPEQLEACNAVPISG